MERLKELRYTLTIDMERYYPSSKIIKKQMVEILKKELKCINRKVWMQLESFRVITIRSSEDFTIYKQFDSTNSTFNQISSPYLHFSHAIYNLITHNPMSIAFISDYKAYTNVFLKCLRANPKCHFSGSKAYSYIYDLTWNDPDVKLFQKAIWD